MHKGNGEPGNAVAAGDKSDKGLVCLQVGDLPPTVIPVHMAVVGCPISSLRTTYYTTDQFQKEPVIRCLTPGLILCPLETLWPPAWAAHTTVLLSSWPRATQQ